MSRLAANSLHLAINRLAQPIFGFVLMVCIGRTSSVLLGEYTLVTVFYLILQTLPLLGLTPHLMREIARRPEAAGTIYGSTVAMASGVALLLAGAMPAVVHLLHYHGAVVAALAVATATMLPGIAAYVAELIFVSLHRTGIIGAVAVAENLLRLVASLAVLATGGGLVALMAVFLAGRLLAALAYLLRLRRILAPAGNLRPDKAELLTLLRTSPVYLLNTLLLLVVSRADFLVLSRYTDAATIAYYAVGYKVLDLSTLVVTAFVGAIYPYLARRDTGAPDNRAFGEMGLRTGKLVFLVTLGLAGGGIAIADPFVALLFPRQYPQAVPLLEILLLVLPLAGLKLATSAILFAADRPRADLAALGLGSLIYVAALFLLVPRYGAAGAAVACLLEAAAQFLLRGWFVRNLWHGQQTPSVSRLATALLIPLVYAGGIGALAGSDISPAAIAAAGIAATLAYAAGCWAGGLIGNDDLRFLGLGHRPAMPGQAGPQAGTS